MPPDGPALSSRNAWLRVVAASSSTPSAIRVLAQCASFDPKLLGRVMGALLQRPLNWRFFGEKADGEGMRFSGDLPADDPSYPLTIAGAFLTRDTPRGIDVIGLYFTIPRLNGPPGMTTGALLDDHLRGRWTKRGAP